MLYNIKFTLMKGTALCIFLISTFLLNVSFAQTRKVVLKEFTFFPSISQIAASNPLALPYNSKSTLISLKIENCQQYETVIDFLNDHKTAFKKSLKPETINQLSAGWVIEKSKNDKTKNLFTGMIKNNSSGAKLLVTMLYPSGNYSSENSSLAMFRSFRPNTTEVGKKTDVSTTPSSTTITNTNTVANTNPSINTVSVKDILSAHNVYRSNLGLPLLTWSAELATYAESWANELSRRNCAFEHRPYSGKWTQKYGENIFTGSNTDFNILSAVKLWGDEKQYYNYKNNSCSAPKGMSCGHYTQMVWKETTKVGCAIVKCKNGSVIVVCNYDPPGNYEGESPY